MGRLALLALSTVFAAGYALISAAPRSRVETPAAARRTDEAAASAAPASRPWASLPSMPGAPRPPERGSGVTGVVLDGDHRGADGIFVAAHKIDGGGASILSHTDEHGGFAVELPPGSYRIVALSGERFATVEIEVAAGEQLVGLELAFERREAPLGVEGDGEGIDRQDLCPDNWSSDDQDGCPEPNDHPALLDGFVQPRMMTY